MAPNLLSLGGMKLFSAVLALGALAGPAAADGPPDCFKNSKPGCTDVGPYAVPRTPEELIALRDKIATDPWGGAAITLLAFMAWQADEKVGEPMLVLAVSEKNVGKSKGAGSYNGYGLSGALKSYLRMTERSKHCARSYAVGATPENRYAFDPSAVTLRMLKPEPATPLDPALTTYKVFVCTSGADSCRPITLTSNKRGIWKADELSSVLVGCKPMAPAPGAEDPADAL